MDDSKIKFSYKDLNEIKNFAQMHYINTPMPIRLDSYFLDPPDANLLITIKATVFWLESKGFLKPSKIKFP